MQTEKRRKALIVCSSGGHLDQTLIILEAFSDYDVVFATFDKADARSRLGEDGFIKVHYPSNRNALNLLRNFYVAHRSLRRERPDIVFSTGAAPAVPFFILAKLRGVSTVFMDCIDRVYLPTLTARLLKHFTTRFICQAEDQMIDWPNRVILSWSR